MKYSQPLLYDSSRLSVLAKGTTVLTNDLLQSNVRVRNSGTNELSNDHECFKKKKKMPQINHFKKLFPDLVNFCSYLHYLRFGVLQIL